MATSGVENSSYLMEVKDVVVKNPTGAIMIIFALLIVSIGLYIYYHGVLGIGPYTSNGSDKSPDSSSNKSAKNNSDDTDSDTEELIKSINKSSKGR